MYNKWILKNNEKQKFTDVFPDEATFINLYQNIGIPSKISEQNAKTLYYLLYARYGNSVIASSDTNRFVYGVFSIIFIYGPSWEKRMEIQETLRNLSEEELQKGSKQIANSALNPSSEPSTGSLEELEYINSQNTNTYKRGKLDAYATLWDLIKTDVTKYFLDQFRTLFIFVQTPSSNLWFKDYDSEDSNDSNNIDNN